MKPRSKIATGSFTFFTLAFIAQQALACGPFSTVYIYNTEDANRYYPIVRDGSFFESPQSMFLDHWGVEYAYPYYRNLTDQELPAETKAQLEKLYAGTYFYESVGTSLRDAVEQWQKARQSVIPESLSVATNQYEGWQSFTNCLSDAFIVAARTLEERKNTYSEQELQEWVRGQDEVFKYCGTRNTIGEQIKQQGSSPFVASAHDSAASPLSFPQRIFTFLGEFFGKVFQGIANLFPGKSTDSPDSDVAEEGSLLAYDQQYQSAAKAFYQWHFSEAEQLFQDIANNSKQPWRPEANLVLGRIYIRQAHSIEDEDRYGMEKPGEVSGEKRRYFEKAKSQFENILADNSLAKMHQGTRSLLNYVNFRVDPETRLQDAENILSRSNDPQEIVENLEDLAWLWYHGVVTEELAFEKGGEFVQWYYIWQHPDTPYVTIALQKYDQTKSTAWLLASLKALPSGHQRENELIGAAQAIPQNSLAYTTAQYYRLKLALQKPNNTQTKQEVETMLVLLDSQKDTVAYNYFADLRMLFSNNLQEALSFSVRKIVGTEQYDGWSAPLSTTEESRLVLDKKARRILNEWAPLETWVEVASESSIFPAETAKQIRLVAFVRAILLNDIQAAQKMAQLLSANNAILGADLDDFLKATQADVKKFSAIFFMLKRPHLNVILDAHVDTADLGDIDTTSYNRAWWCSFDPEDNNPYKRPYFGSRLYDITPLENLISAQEKTQAQLEIKIVGDTKAPNYLTQEAIWYATKHPQDARVPEALHLAVFSARSPCHTDSQTKQLAKEAFQLLHRNYPNNSWTEATPYWY